MCKNQLPGTAEHQRILQLIVNYYAAVPGILAIGLFGSLARGDWDEFSDLDLDIVIADEYQLIIDEELAGLCKFLQEHDEEALIVLADRSDAGDVVLASLVQFSIRYHPLATTNWKIVDSLQFLCGSLDLESIIAAGEANRATEQPITPGILLDRYLRYASGVSIDLERGRLWGAIELLHRMRQLLMQLYADTYGCGRVVQTFQTDAPTSLQDKLTAMLPQGELRSVLFCLQNGLDLLTDHLGDFTNGQVPLTDTQHRLIQKIRQRVTAISLSTVSESALHSPCASEC